VGHISMPVHSGRGRNAASSKNPGSKIDGILAIEFSAQRLNEGQTLVEVSAVVTAGPALRDIVVIEAFHSFGN
jgi:hypothetical protein